MSIAHFSDVIRFFLLKQHGGLWIDATCLITQDIPSSIFEYNFYSLDGAYSNDLKWKWTSWFMYAKKGDIIIKNMCHFYELYWNEFNSAVTYLFLDCWLLALYNNVPEIKNEIELYPDCHSKCYAFIGNWSKPYSENLYNVLETSFFISKMTYKGVLPPKGGTIYGFIVKSK